MTEPFLDKVIRKCVESMEMMEMKREVFRQVCRAFWDLVHIALGEEDVT